MTTLVRGGDGQEKEKPSSKESQTASLQEILQSNLCPLWERVDNGGPAPPGKGSSMPGLFQQIGKDSEQKSVY